MASKTLRVYVVTSWETACGIAEHSMMLKHAVEAADDGMEIVPSAAWLDPAVAIGEWDHAADPDQPVVVHLNYQASLHSRWTPGTIRALGYPTVVTYHDTGVPNSDQGKAVIDAADAVVVHEPFDDLPVEKTRYWRMGVCGAVAPFQYSPVFRDRPILGTVGFPFPWKCYDELARVTAANGWGLVLLAPGSMNDDWRRWKAINPHVWIEDAFLPREEVQARLAGCDATAFTYVCHNTGQSGAILQGIAARKPVIALRTCRQMRALALDPLGAETICWAETFDDVGGYLRHLPLGRLDAGIVALAHQERWSAVGEKYAALYREVARGELS